mmetsp:Transcript_31591/g.97610  ORF Transcript_31591/g.97610 Transcript_31591/m.97610 type:complete len:219 (-) Transcript_31591:1938-2594(-)
MPSPSGATNSRPASMYVLVLRCRIVVGSSVNGCTAASYIGVSGSSVSELRTGSTTSRSVASDASSTANAKRFCRMIARSSSDVAPKRRSWASISSRSDTSASGTPNDVSALNSGDGSATEPCARRHAARAATRSVVTWTSDGTDRRSSISSCVIRCDPTGFGAREFANSACVKKNTGTPSTSPPLEDDSRTTRDTIDSASAAAPRRAQTTSRAVSNAR